MHQQIQIRKHLNTVPIQSIPKQNGQAEDTVYSRRDHDQLAYTPALWDNRTFCPEPLACLSYSDQALFELFGSGPRMRPRHEAVHLGFEAYAAVQPQAIAIEHEGERITYAQLNARAENLGRIMRRKGVKSGDAVALYLQRSIAMVIGILATLKIGAAYVPQHVGVTPGQTLEHISKVTGARIILTVSEFADEIPILEGQEVLCVDRLSIMPRTQFHQEEETQAKIRPDDRCFILFTSGTTGVPNGVQVTHRNVCNILQTSPGNLGIRPGMKVGQILSIAFDMAAWEILGCLSNGGTLVIRGKSIQETAEKVDVIIATPSILGSIDASKCFQVKVVAVAGEPCPRPLADLWSSFCTFYNSCGPTETTIINTAEPHYPAKPVLSIGRPTPNNTVYILDENLKPCAIGEVGEMWAGGDCVSAGYLANEQLTSERYRPDPFLGGDRLMFRTRDLGRWTADGELEHFGRVDDQVKIRGFRVELDSVSAVLESIAGCRQAVTIKLDDRNLAAFVCAHEFDQQAAAKAIAKRLPYYCVPEFIIAVDDIPRTSRGKVDKRLLLQIAKKHQVNLAAEVI